MHSAITWIVVANSTEARIFKLVKFPKIEEIDSLIHPESHFLNQDLISSKPGHNIQSKSYQGSSYEPKTTPKQLEIDKFAKILGDQLSRSCQEGKFERLYVFCEASFLGHLRQHFDGKTKNAVVIEVNKDLTKHPIADIEKTLGETAM